jgi:hypothetical protein
MLLRSPFVWWVGLTTLPLNVLSKSHYNLLKSRNMIQSSNSDQAPTDDIIRRPGPGWRFIGCSSWRHESGVIVHCLGVALMPDGTVRYESETRLAEGYIRLAGGNRKRGLMMWGLALHRIQKKSKRLVELFKTKESPTLSKDN